VLRATVLGRPPAVRAAGAIELLNRLAREVPQGRVTTRPYPDGVLVAIDDRPVFVVMSADADALAGETMTSKATEAAGRLDIAFREAVELRTPGRLVPEIAVAAGLTLLYVFLIWLAMRFYRRVEEAAERATERQLAKMSAHEIGTAVRAPHMVRRLVGVLAIVFGLVLTYAWLAAVLRRFPYTRPWGESLRAGLLGVAGSAGRSVLDQMPNLLTVLAIILITRFMIRLVNLAFAGVETQRFSLPWVHPETAQPTRRIVVLLLWLFALVVSYNYLPGSQSDVFKGISVFVGLVVSLGSSGIMNQAMSGLMLTYSRALRVNDFVRVADVEGTVTHIGALSTKIRTSKNEDITIPNAVMVSQATTNYSRFAESDGVYTPTSVTIGYDTPWRQIHALLLLAAERTAGVRQEPKPVVLQTALQDFYVQYTLLVSLEQPRRKMATLNVLHSNIQDAFNEYGVQIMSPNYEADPSDRKIVPPSHWYNAPAVAPQAATTGPVGLPDGGTTVGRS
jgi:small-conductance mechanosensitive channel